MMAKIGTRALSRTSIIIGKSLAFERIDEQRHGQQVGTASRAQAPRCEVATNRRALIPHPAAAKTAPSTSATVAPSRPTRPKQSAASAAPIVCPIRRAVATTPLALPLRSEGALDIKAFMFGA